MKLTHTVSLVEVVWTVFTFLGFFYSCRILIRAVGDLQAVRIAGQNHLREYSARLAVFTYGTWSFVQFMFVIVGAIALTLPSPRNDGQPATLSFVIAAIFILGSFALAMASFLVESGRERLIKMIEESDNGT